MPDTTKRPSWKCVSCGLRTGTKCECGSPCCGPKLKGSCHAFHMLKMFSLEDWKDMVDEFASDEDEGAGDNSKGGEA